MIYFGIIIVGGILVIALLVLLIVILHQNKKEKIAYRGGYNAVTGFQEDVSAKVFKGIDAVNADTFCVDSSQTEISQISCRLYNSKRKKYYEFYIGEGKKIRIGRDESQSNRSDYLYIKGDSSISKQHCRLSYINGYIVIEDTNSANHTFVNGRKISGKKILKSNDTIKIGNTKLIIQC